jgi:hypothetical protein
MFKTLMLMLAAPVPALGLVSVTSLASAGIIMPTRSIGVTQMHSAPTASPTLGTSSIRSQSGIIDPNDRNAGSQFKRKVAPVKNITDPCTKDPSKCM